MKKKVLIILVILLIILCGILIYMKFIGNSNTQTYNKPENEVTKQKIEKVKSDVAYFTVQSCVEKYINYLSEGNNEIIYNLLDNDYIKKYNVTKLNVKNYVEQVYEMSTFKTKQMYVENIDNDNQIYYVKGILQEISGGENTILRCTERICCNNKN